MRSLVAGKQPCKKIFTKGKHEKFAIEIESTSLGQFGRGFLDSLQLSRAWFSIIVIVAFAVTQRNFSSIRLQGKSIVGELKMKNEKVIIST